MGAGRAGFVKKEYALDIGPIGLIAQQAQGDDGTRIYGI
jgi:hypothetical protein